MKAMILAAGRGERLRPFTDTIPKPLLEVGQHRLIEYHLFKLAQLGIHEVVINVSYLKEAIMNYLGDGTRYGLTIHYSIEEPGPLETGGGIFQALQNGLLDDNPFILLSADIWSDYPLESLPKDLQADAYLVMADNPSFHPSGDFGLRDNHIATVAPLLTYANVALINPRIFANATAGFFKLAPLLLSSINADRVDGEHYQGAWFNVGIADALQALQQFLLNLEKG